MREAIANAVVGDEQRREDPTVNELERRVAELLGQEESVYVPTATMANEIALRTLSEPGAELIAEENAHLLLSELGGPAVFAGLMTRPIRGQRGRFGPDEVQRMVRRTDETHTPPTRVVAIENTHNASGGRVWPLEEIRTLVATCRELELSVHLDGARLLNAAIASGVPAAEIGGTFDTVTLCLSKGLGCPLGALVAGSNDLMRKARRFKHQFGGAMRQAGIVAAAGIYALDHNVERLADDHARAKRLADGIGIDPATVETNFVPIADEPGLRERLAERGVGVGGLRQGWLRAVTHLDIDDDDIDQAVERMQEVLSVRA